GPGTLEDITTGVDALFNPLTYIFFFAPVGSAISWGVSVGTTGAYYVNQGVSYLPSYSNLKEVSIDPYIAMRNAYLQNYDYGMAKVLKQQLSK
ncbi:MlaA family lipoprotein, partial [Francisella tularensis]